jgi:hypothetical protein
MLAMDEAWTTGAERELGTTDAAAADTDSAAALVELDATALGLGVGGVAA